MKCLNKILIILIVFVLSSCSSLSSLKFWGDDDEEEGPEELYSIENNRSLEKNWSFSNDNEILYGRLIPAIYEGKVFYINSTGYISSVDLDSGKLRHQRFSPRLHQFREAHHAILDRKTPE